MATGLTTDRGADLRRPESGHSPRVLPRVDVATHQSSGWVGDDAAYIADQVKTFSEPIDAPTGRPRRHAMTYQEI